MKIFVNFKRDHFKDIRKVYKYDSNFAGENTR